MEDRLTEVVPSKGKKSDVIPMLQRIQAEFGYIPEEAMAKVAESTGLTESKVFGVASFYAQFRFTPIGRNRIMLCRGTACHVKGAPQILAELERVLGIKEGETTPDLEYTLESVACIGCCGLAPCITTNKDVHGRLTPKAVRGLFANLKGEAQDAN
jgi:NADH-quinone oxidoreductase subunit E